MMKLLKWRRLFLQRKTIPDGKMAKGVPDNDIAEKGMELLKALDVE